MLTSRLDAYISRYGDFCAHDDNNDNDDDDNNNDYFTPCACARGNKVSFGLYIARALCAMPRLDVQKLSSSSPVIEICQCRG